MIYLKLILILFIIYLFFCLILIALRRHKKEKNPIIFVDEIQEIINFNRELKEKEEEKEKINNNFEYMS